MPDAEAEFWGKEGKEGEGCCHGVRESEMDVDTVVVCVIVC